MSPTLVVLLLAAAAAHATWNLLAKQAGGGLAFVWLAAMAEASFLAPFALVLYGHELVRLGTLDLLFVAGSGLLHTGYLLLLQRGYRDGDLSVVYPVARGTGPLLASGAAIVLFQERPTPLAVVGALVITGSILSFVGSPARLLRAESHRSLAFAVTSGCFIAAYTVWDKEAVTGLSIAPVLYLWGIQVCRSCLLLPLAARRWRDVRRLWRLRRRNVVGFGLLSPTSYLLVLVALTLAPVSYVAPGREISVLVGAALGSQVLDERDGRRRLAAAAAVFVGLLALAFG